MGHRIIASGQSDTGRARQANEDAFGLFSEHKLWVLADGMGGHAAGQVASQMTVDEIGAFISSGPPEAGSWPFTPRPSEPLEKSMLMNAVRIANIRVYNRSLREPQCNGMGTTVVALHLGLDGALYLASVGDSRCYRLRGQNFEQLTRDHSLLNHLVDEFGLSLEEAKTRVGSNVIVRAIGLEDDVLVDLHKVTIEDGDRLLLCSDGLSDLVSDQQIAQLLAQPSRLDRLTGQLIDAANEAGGLDNITVVLLEVRADDTPTLDSVNLLS